MITTITKFQLPHGASLDQVRSALKDIAPEFQRPSELLSKFFLISESGPYGGGVYLWQNRSDASAFEPTIRAMVREKMGVEAEISYFETPVVVDNTQKEIKHA
jgi:Putative mono-oxygenase ydhR